MTKTAPDHLSRKEIKGPDQFQVAATQAAEWMAKRRRHMLIAAGAAVAAVLVVVLIVQMRSSSARDAGAMLYRVIDAAGGEISSVPLSGVPAPLYKTDAERQRAVVEAAEKLRQRHGGTRAALTGTLLEGHAQYRLGQYDKALEAYRAYVSGTSSDDSMRFAALGGIAYALEAKGQLDDAAKAWDDAASLKFYSDRAALEKARVLARAGKVDAARDILKAYPEQHKDSMLQPEAAEQLARLGAK